MSSGPWGLTPGELSFARAANINTAGSISEQLDSLGRYVDELCSQWHGNAQMTFQTLMGEYHTHASNLQQTLESIAANLGANHDTVFDTEQLNMRLLTPHGDSGSDLRPPRF
jgi:WXG100 family type VII secretion target